MNRMALTSPLATLTVVIVVSGLGACGQSSSSQAPVPAHDNSSGFVPDTKPLPAVKWLDATVPEGTVLNLSSIDSLNSGSTRKGDPFRTLVTDAIHLSRIEASQMRLNLQSRSLRAVVHETLRHMKSATDGREVELSLPDDLPSVLVDPELIQLVFRHLIDNALKYSPVGSPIAVGARSDGGFVALSIRNVVRMVQDHHAHAGGGADRGAGAMMTEFSTVCRDRAPAPRS